MALPEFKDDPTRVMHVAVISVFSFFALLAVILRLWARKIQKNVWEVSDYLIVAGLVRSAQVEMKRLNSDGHRFGDLPCQFSQYTVSLFVADLEERTSC